MTYKPFRNILIWFGVLFITIFVFGGFLYELKYGREIKNLNSLYIIGALGISIFTLPVLIITLLYFKENRHTSFEISQNKKQIEITIKGESKTYSIAEIESSIYHRQSYQRDIFWKGFFGYSDLGYVDLTFKNNDRYYLTCFLLDITREPIFENSLIKYSFLPAIDRTDSKKIKVKVEQQTNKRIEKLKIKFANKSIAELNEILENKSKYQNEAIIATKKILKNKNVV